MNSDWDTLYLLVNLSNKKYGVFFVVVVVLFCFVLFFVSALDSQER